MGDGRARTDHVIRRDVHRRTWTVLFASILWFGLTVSTAPVSDAHAVLETSSPADGSVLEGSPARVLLTFSEPVTLVRGAIRVFDVSGRRVDDGIASHAGTGTQVAVGLKPDLATGSYAVAWRVISADAHPVHGGFVFSVHRPGQIGALDSFVEQPSQPGLQVIGSILRAIGYLGALVVVGAAVFVAFVRRRRADRTLPTGWLSGVAGVAVLAQLAQLPVAATLATGEGLGSIFSSSVLPDVLAGGVAATVAGVALATLAARAAIVDLGPRWTLPRRRAAAVVTVVLIAGAFAASGHTRSAHPGWLVVIADTVHVAAAAIWVGGVVMLAWTVRTSKRVPDDPVTVADEVRSFSRLATVTIVAVAAAGVVLALIEIGSISGLVQTAYGRLVLAKVGLLVALGVLGAFNHFRLVPALVKRPDRVARWGYLHRTLRLEALALVAVLGVTGVLVDAVPAKTALDAKAVYSAEAKLGSGSLNLVIDPARTGPTALHTYLLDAQGRPDDDVAGVEVALTQPKLGIGPVITELHRAGPGHFVANGTLFGVPGRWTVTVRVRVDEFTEQAAVLRVNVSG